MSFEYLELPSVSLRTSLTIDGPQVLRRASENNADGEYIEFPLGMFPKSLLGSFDLTDSNGCSIPLLRSDYDSSVAVGILKQELLRQDVSESAITDSVLDKLFRVASKQDGDNIIADLEWIDENSPRLDLGKVVEIFGKDLYEIISHLKNTDGFLNLLVLFGGQYIPIVQLDKSNFKSAFVIKYRQVTHSPELSFLNARNALGYIWKPTGGDIEVHGVNLGKAGSQHFRASAPDGTVLADLSMFDAISGIESTQNNMAHITPRWASLYTKFSHNLGPLSVRLSLIPDARPIMIPAIAALLTSVAVLGTGIALQLSDTLGKAGPSEPRLENIALHSSGAVIAMLLLLPSLFLLALVRRDEHGVASSLLRYPRYAIAGAAVAAISSAIPAAFSTDSSLTIKIWSAALIVSLSVLILVSRHWYCIEKLQKDSRNNRWNQDMIRGGPEAGW